MSEVFHIVPAGTRSIQVLVPAFAVALVVLAGTALVMGMTVKASRGATFEVTASGLRLRGDLYGRRLPASDLRGGAARVVDLRHEGALRPARRTMGTAVPGYRAGWFRLANGDKALLYVTDPRQVVYVPTRSGYALLLSVDRPGEFVERLRAIAPGT